jgi:hypothetical protein
LLPTGLLAFGAAALGLRAATDCLAHGDCAYFRAAFDHRAAAAIAIGAILSARAAAQVAAALLSVSADAVVRDAAWRAGAGAADRRSALDALASTTCLDAPAAPRSSLDATCLDALAR